MSPEEGVERKLPCGAEGRKNCRQVSKMEGKETSWKYLEPDFGRYETLIKEKYL